MTYIILCIVYYIHLHTIFHTYIYIYIYKYIYIYSSIQEVGLGHEEILPARWGFHDFPGGFLGDPAENGGWRMENPRKIRCKVDDLGLLQILQILKILDWCSWENLNRKPWFFTMKYKGFL